MSPVDNTQEAMAALAPTTRAVHADDGISSHKALAPAMHVSTTFRYNDDPDTLRTWDNTDARDMLQNVADLQPDAPRDSHVYSRDSAPNTTRLEAVLSSLLGGPALTYASGLAAFHAMIVHLNPKRVAIGDGYHGCHGVLEIMKRLTGLMVVGLDSDELEQGDVIHVETPLNPTGEARNLEHYTAKARRCGAVLTCDATFAPPPLQEPFQHGVDIIMHSGTKYFGGHSDMLCGVLAVNPNNKERWQELKRDRMLLGSVMGSFEGWLGLRSLRTLELRVIRQSKTATALAQWLEDERQGGHLPTLKRVSHASLQPQAKEANSWLQRQMPNGYGPVFALYLSTADAAKRLPSKLTLFHHATSLGGVESCIEWRRMTDPTVDDTLLRVSVGVEDIEDLKTDLKRALTS